MFLAKSTRHKYGEQHVPVMYVDIIHPSCLEGIIDMGGRGRTEAPKQRWRWKNGTMDHYQLLQNNIKQEQSSC